MFSTYITFLHNSTTTKPLSCELHTRTNSRAERTVPKLRLHCTTYCSHN